MKKRCSKLVLALVIMLFVTIYAAFSASADTLRELQNQFPNGTYWNHAGMEGVWNNQDCTTNTPCNHNKTKNTCNHFDVGDGWIASQCMGFAEKLGYEYTGFNPHNDQGGWKTYTNKCSLDNLKTGDIFRYKTSNDGHSIFITSVSGNNVEYADCNSKHTCNIRWNEKTTITDLKNKTFIHVRSAPTPQVTFNGNGLKYNSTIKVNINNPIGKLPTIERAGYKLNGWYTAKTGGKKISSFTTVTKNTTFYAQWSEQMQDVTSSYKNKKIIIKSVQNGRYLSFASKNDAILYALAKKVSTWETFSTAASGEWIGFKAYNGKYLSATSNKDRLQASASKISTWECFKIYQKGKYFYIKSRKNNKYLTEFVDEKNASVRAYQKKESTWERFEINVK